MESGEMNGSEAWRGRGKLLNAPDWVDGFHDAAFSSVPHDEMVLTIAAVRPAFVVVVVSDSIRPPMGDRLGRLRDVPACCEKSFVLHLSGACGCEFSLEGIAAAVQ
jgi:hypothetical protein